MENFERKDQFNFINRADKDYLAKEYRNPDFAQKVLHSTRETLSRYPVIENAIEVFSQGVEYFDPILGPDPLRRNTVAYKNGASLAIGTLRIINPNQVTFSDITKVAEALTIKLPKITENDIKTHNENARTIIETGLRNLEELGLNDLVELVVDDLVSSIDTAQEFCSGFGFGAKLVVDASEFKDKKIMAEELKNGIDWDFELKNL